MYVSYSIPIVRNPKIRFKRFECCWREHADRFDEFVGHYKDGGVGMVLKSMDVWAIDANTIRVVVHTNHVH